MEVQLELNRRGVPFLVRSGQRFFEQRHIKDVLAFLRFVDNPRDQLAFQRIALLADGVGAKTANRLFTWIQAHGDLESALAHPDARAVVGRRAQASWGALSTTLLGLTQPTRRDNAAEALEWVREQIYEPYAQRAYDNFPNRLREIETLTNYATQHGTVRGFIDSLSLEGDASGLDLDPGGDDDEQVVLSTVHQSKGLEFQAVFVLWLAEDRFPHARASDTREELEEERRLFYVATTRAQRELYLTSPMLAFDRREGTIVLRPSPFVREVEGASDNGPVLERWDLVHE
jgi:DNA helicase-2/ATP-dependent DNA helicase PcrA